MDFCCLKKCVTSIYRTDCREPLQTLSLSVVNWTFDHTKKTQKRPWKMLHVWITWPLKYHTWLDPHNWSCRSSEHRSSSSVCLLSQRLLCRLSSLWLCVKDGRDQQYRSSCGRKHELVSIKLCNSNSDGTEPVTWKSKQVRRKKDKQKQTRQKQWRIHVKTFCTWNLKITP